MLDFVAGGLNENHEIAFTDKIAELKSSRLELTGHTIAGLDPKSLTVDSPVPFSLKKLWYDLIDFETTTYVGAQRDQPALEAPGDLDALTPPKYKPHAMGSAGPYLNTAAKGIRRQLGLLRSRLLDRRYDFILHPGPWEPDGSKERVAIGDGIRESKESWRELLLDLKARGLKCGPRLATGDGAMGFWAALNEVFPKTRHQRCWVHKMVNVLDALPKSLQGKAKADLKEIWMAPTLEVAEVAFKRFVAGYGDKYPQAVAKLKKDEDALLAFYDFPAEHWIHIRTTNPIESTFATVRHRSSRTRNCVSRDTFLGLAFKLIEAAEKSWHKINGADKIPPLLQGTVFKNGEAVKDNLPPVDQKLAA